ncbi:MAG: response regulator transcription factor [Acidobacteriota bacterium]|nr:response regulator transcription factor [Acidobacteriota bacterium]
MSGQAPARIVLIEDDADLAFTVALALRREGWNVQAFGTGGAALDAIRDHGCDLVLLDLNLPDIDGLSVCRDLRRDAATRALPILMLTARVDERDRLLGFDLGADDYVTKPFSTRELVARIRALLRRATPVASEGLVAGDLKIDRGAHRVTLGDAPVRLTKKEFDLLCLLVESRPRVVSRDTILSRVWGYSGDVETRTVDAHIKLLRRKIGDSRIETVVGVGYRFREDA